MVRVKRGSVARKRRRKILSLAKGSVGSNSYLFRIAQQHTIKSLCYAYRRRRAKKRQFRSFWVIRLNAMVRMYGWNYNSFIRHLFMNKCMLNRKTIVQLSIYDPSSFQVLFLLKCLLIVTYIYIVSSVSYTISYKNVNLLRRYIGITGKILPRRVTKLSTKDHRRIAKAIRQARIVGIMPFVWLTK